MRLGLKRAAYVLAASLVTVAMGSQAAKAHPHIFIDSGVEVIFDAQGQVTALRISWSYDDFYSLLAIEDYGFDPDGDSRLTADEQAKLTGFDMAWEAGYNGDLYVLNQGAPVALGGPQEVTARYEDGIITSTHLRKLETPQQPAPEGMVIQVYDSGYYTAYHIASEAVLTNAPAGCVAPVFTPDLSAADEKLYAVLQEYQPGDDVEVDFPAVGANYADEVRLTCPAR